MTRLLLCFLCLAFGIGCFAQEADSNTVIRFDFNGQQIRENDNRVLIKPVGVVLVADRFGNASSAIHTEGNASSYVNLGSSTLIKPARGTLSMWVNLQVAIMAGKGYDSNPMLIIKNSPGEDFCIGLGLIYDYRTNHIGVMASKDSITEVNIGSTDTVALNTWYHMVVTYDDHYFSYYVNGELQSRQIKSFRSYFTPGDSVVLGRNTGPKNERYCRAMFDDLRFYHRVLSEKEVKELYNEPNPNRVKNIISEIMKYGLVITGLVLVIIFLLIRNKRSLQRQKESYELRNRVNELEIKAIKSQMNPHFISNSMAAIQDLIYKKDYEKSSQYIAKLGLLMRQILDYSDKTYISLEEELNIIRLNVELEQLRFGNNFSFAISIEDNIDTREVMIPSLITQPFIENAIWHGLLPLENRTPVLKVRVFRQNNMAFVSIEDNGVGRSVAQGSNDKSSHGIRLATEKIEGLNRLMNSSDFRLEIVDLYDEQKQPAGTRIIIQLLNTFEE